MDAFGGFPRKPQQFIVIREQEDDFALDAALLELLDEMRDRLDFRRCVACIDAHGRTAVLRIVVEQGVRYERLQQGRRDVVDAIEAGIFEHVQRTLCRTPTAR
jgi:hypothetical protein